VIQEGNLVLRPVEEADIPLVARWMNNVHVSHWMDYDAPVSEAEVRTDIRRARAEGVALVIEVDKVPVGRIGLNQLRPRDRRASTYMYIGEDTYRGRGYGSKAMQLLLNYAFEVKNLRLVELWALAHNEAALANYKKVGFREDARLRARSFHGRHAIDGGEPGYVDTVIMSITDEEFRALVGG